MTGAVAGAAGLPAIIADWGNVSGPSGLPTDTNADVTMTASGTIKVTFTGSPSAVAIWQNGASATISSGDSVAVSVGDTIHFSIVKFSAGSGVVTVTNETLGGAVIDTFTWEQT